MCVLQRGFTPWGCNPVGFTISKWNTHGNVVTLHLDSDHNKIPWEAFRDTRSYLNNRKKLLSLGGVYSDWLNMLDVWKQQCVGKQIYLSLDVSENRNPFPRESIDPSWVWPFTWQKDGLPSFERVYVRQALKRYARFLVEHFNPIALCLQAEIDTIWVRNNNQFGVDWNGSVKQYVIEAREFIKNTCGNIPIFVGFQYEMQLSLLDVYNCDYFTQDSWDGLIDIFGFSTYPNKSGLGISYERVDAIPDNWIFRLQQRFNHLPFALLETYWLADGNINSIAEQEQAKYVQRLMQTVRGLNPFLVNWFFYQDFLYSTSIFGKQVMLPWAAGLVRADGSERAALAVWDAN